MSYILSLSLIAGRVVDPSTVQAEGVISPRADRDSEREIVIFFLLLLVDDEHHGLPVHRARHPLCADAAHRTHRAGLGRPEHVLGRSSAVREDPRLGLRLRDEHQTRQRDHRRGRHRTLSRRSDRDHG